MIRKVLYSPAGKIHPSQYSLIHSPPEGYEFTVQRSKLDRLVSNRYTFDNLRLQVLDKLVPLNLVKGSIDSLSTPKGVSLVYAYNHIVLGRPYVVHVEWAHILSGRSPTWFYLTQPLISRLLKQPNCKKIITWTQAARRNILDLYSLELDSKITVIPPAFPSRQVKRDYSKKKVSLLFVGSSNQSNDFEEKGGYALLKAFESLRHKYRGMVTLTMRALVPLSVKKQLLEGVTFYEELLTPEKLDSLYRASDIFVLPTYLYQNTAVIEAMSYGLPIVTTPIGSSLGEYVEEGATGLVAPDSGGYFRDGLIVTETTSRRKFIRTLRVQENSLANLLTEQISWLIDSPGLRQKLGEGGKREVDIGRFSIEMRNKKLKEIFDEAFEENK